MELRIKHVVDRIQEAVATSDDPICAYIYDLEALRSHAQRLLASLPPDCELFYAIKANSELPILQTVAPLVHGFEVSSGGELGWVTEKFPHVPVIFSGPGKLESEIEAAVLQGVECLHVESMTELRRLAAACERLGKAQDILVRVNLALENFAQTTLMMGGKPTPFGIPAGDLPACLDWLQSQSAIRLRGFHFHLLSHQLDAKAHLRMLTGCLEQVREWCARFRLSIEHVNVGGGIGINYREPERQFDWPGFCEGLAGLLKASGLPGVKLRFEIGRYMTAACGYYAMQVIDIKRSYGKTFVVGRGGSHHFRTPSAQGHSHPFEVIAVDRWAEPFERPKAVNEAVSVVGQLCTPKDLLAFDTPVEQVRCNDIVLFTYAGAYAWHISHHDFLRHPRPRQWYLPAIACECE